MVNGAVLSWVFKLIVLFVQKDDFILFNHSWSAGEEMCLLNAVAECGFGNW